MNQPKVGDPVIYHDPSGVAHNALVNCVWSDKLVNLVYVSSDDKREDSYGRQIERSTSCHHKSVMPVHGNYWRSADEEPNPVVQPIES